MRDDREIAAASTVAEVLAIRARRQPAAPAILAPGRPALSYGTLAAVVDRTAQTLAGSGLGRGKRIVTVAEQGFPSFAVATWYGLVAPAATPAAIIAKLDQALVQTLRSDDVRQHLLQQGYEPIDAPASLLGPLIRSDIAKYATLIKSAGIKTEE